MAPERDGRQVELTDDGQVVAAADVQPLDPNVVRASLHADAGHLPVGTRSRLVDAVLDLPEAGEGRKLEATLPLGDTEGLDRLRARCQNVQTRPAGATCLVDAELPAGDRSDVPGSRR
jgi:uncharacterized phage protein gp47/JayE